MRGRIKFRPIELARAERNHFPATWAKLVPTQVWRWALSRLEDVILLPAVMQRLRRGAESAFDPRRSGCRLAD
jgi:hypothetical protein